MKLQEYIKEYKNYETKELARRASKKKKIIPYKYLKNKRIPVKKASKLKITARGIMEAIDNPYRVKFYNTKKKK